MASRAFAATLLALAVGLLSVAPAQADVFTVTTTTDAANPAAGCTVLQCTLRNAIAAAAGNGNTTDDEVVVATGTYELVQGTLTVPAGATRITIRGAGPTRRSSDRTSKSRHAS